MEQKDKPVMSASLEDWLEERCSILTPAGEIELLELVRTNPEMAVGIVRFLIKSLRKSEQGIEVYNSKYLRECNKRLEVEDGSQLMYRQKEIQHSLKHAGQQLEMMNRNLDIIIRQQKGENNG